MARHRYVFRLYALDAEQELAAGAAKAGFGQAIEGDVLTIAELVGTYKRRARRITRAGAFTLDIELATVESPRRVHGQRDTEDACVGRSRK